jgi:hypothetical protein
VQEKCNNNDEFIHKVNNLNTASINNNHQKRQTDQEVVDAQDTIAATANLVVNESAYATAQIEASLINNISTNNINASLSKLDLTVSNSVNLNVSSSELIAPSSVVAASSLPNETTTSCNDTTGRPSLPNATASDYDYATSIEHLGKTANSLTFVSDLNNLSNGTIRQSVGILEHLTQQPRQSQQPLPKETNTCNSTSRKECTGNQTDEKNMNSSSPSLSPSSPTSLTSTSSSSPYSVNNDSEIIQHLFNNFNNSNDINPRKNSPSNYF